MNYTIRIGKTSASITLYSEVPSLRVSDAELRTALRGLRARAASLMGSCETVQHVEIYFESPTEDYMLENVER